MERKAFNNMFIAEAKTWATEKVPYQHQGITRRGCDCSGLVIGVLKSLGYLDKYSLEAYAVDWCLHKGDEKLIEALEQVADEIKLNQIEPGDILLFKFGRSHSHAAIFIGGNLMIHNYMLGEYCRYGRIKDSLWATRMKKAYRFKQEFLAEVKEVKIEVSAISAKSMLGFLAASGPQIAALVEGITT